MQNVFNGTPVNDAPTARNNTIDVVMNEEHTFAITDFGFEDTIDNDRLEKAKIKVLIPKIYASMDYHNQTPK